MVLIYAYGKGLTIYCRLLFTCSMFMTIMSLSQSIKVIYTNQHIHKTYKHHILDGCDYLEFMPYYEVEGQSFSNFPEYRSKRP